MSLAASAETSYAAPPTQHNKDRDGRRQKRRVKVKSYVPVPESGIFSILIFIFTFIFTTI